MVNMRKGHGSYLAAVRVLADLSAISDQDPMALQQVATIISHIVNEPYCRRCGACTEMDDCELALHDRLVGEGVGLAGPIITVEGQDGSDDVVVDKPFREIKAALSYRRIRCADNRVRETSVRMSVPEKGI